MLLFGTDKPTQIKTRFTPTTTSGQFSSGWSVRHDHHFGHASTSFHEETRSAHRMVSTFSISFSGFSFYVVAFLPTRRHGQPTIQGPETPIKLLLSTKGGDHPSPYCLLTQPRPQHGRPRLVIRYHHSILFFRVCVPGFVREAVEETQGACSGSAGRQQDSG